MNGVLLDTNIILDIALERREFFEKSKEVLILINESRIPVFITATTITDIYKTIDFRTSELQVLTPVGFIQQFKK